MDTYRQTPRRPSTSSRRLRITSWVAGLGEGVRGRRRPRRDGRPLPGDRRAPTRTSGTSMPAPRFSTKAAGPRRCPAYPTSHVSAGPTRSAGRRTWCASARRRPLLPRHRKDADRGVTATCRSGRAVRTATGPPWPSPSSWTSAGPLSERRGIEDLQPAPSHSDDAGVLDRAEELVDGGAAWCRRAARRSSWVSGIRTGGSPVNNSVSSLSRWYSRRSAGSYMESRSWEARRLISAANASSSRSSIDRCAARRPSST